VDVPTALATMLDDTSRDAQLALYSALVDGQVEVGMHEGAVLVERLADGRPAALAFSGEAARRRFAPALEFVEMPATDAFGGILAGGVEAVVLDPGGPVRVELGSWEMRRLAAGELPDPDAPPQRDGQVAIEPATELPEAFLAAIRDACAARDDVDRLAVYEADPIRGRRHLLLAVATDADADVTEPAAALHAQLQPVAPDGARLSFAHLIDAEPFRDTAAAATVYERLA
jgi:hypothetical protein